MPSSFWSNTIWYVLLFITSIISMVFVLIKSKNRKFTIAFTLATLGWDLPLGSCFRTLFRPETYCQNISFRYN